MSDLQLLPVSLIMKLPVNKDINLGNEQWAPLSDSLSLRKLTSIHQPRLNLIHAGGNGTVPGKLVWHYKEKKAASQTPDEGISCTVKSFSVVAGQMLSIQIPGSVDINPDAPQYFLGFEYTEEMDATEGALILGELTGLTFRDSQILKHAGLVV